MMCTNLGDKKNLSIGKIGLFTTLSSTYFEWFVSKVVIGCKRSTSDHYMKSVISTKLGLEWSHFHGFGESSHGLLICTPDF